MTQDSCKRTPPYRMTTLGKLFDNLLDNKINPCFSVKREALRRVLKKPTTKVSVCTPCIVKLDNNEERKAFVGTDDEVTDLFREVYNIDSKVSWLNTIHLILLEQGNKRPGKPFVQTLWTDGKYKANLQRIMHRIIPGKGYTFAVVVSGDSVMYYVAVPNDTSESHAGP